MRTVAVLLLLVGGSFLSAQDSGQAYIKEFSGKVELKAPGTETWIPATTGAPLSRDTIVSTGFKSTALVALGNSVLLVRPLTRLTLTEIQNAQGNETVRVSLQTGRVRADVTPPPGGKTDFTVQSPMVTASVRGTSFDFDGINLHVDQGRVHVTGGDNSAVYVGAGHRSSSDPRTGRTAGAAQTAKEDLAPPLPTAVAESMPVPPAIVPDGRVDFNLDLSFIP
ncbi:MAG: FecR domain-containing protein [Treponema sp.]|jgi:hypothetical protein|nr:FecR domain-containing protein [Treponema sp.]